MNTTDNTQSPLLSNLESTAIAPITMTTDACVAWASSLSHDDGWRQAFLSVKDELLALDPSRLATIRVNVSDATVLVRRQVPRIASLQTDFDRDLRGFPPDIGARLDTVSLAMDFAQLAFDTARSPGHELETLRTACIEHRRLLGAALEPLVAFGHLEPAQLATQRDGKSSIGIAQDVRAMVMLIEGDAAPLRSRLLVSDEQVEAARKDAARLMECVSDRKLHDARAEAAAELRARAWTLLSDTWDRVRSAVTYVRRGHGDADSFAPSFVSALRAAPAVSDNGTHDDAADPDAPEPGTGTDAGHPAPAAPAVAPKPESKPANGETDAAIMARGGVLPATEEEKAAFARLRALQEGAKA